MSVLELPLKGSIQKKCSVEKKPKMRGKLSWKLGYCNIQVIHIPQKIRKWNWLKQQASPFLKWASGSPIRCLSGVSGLGSTQNYLFLMLRCSKGNLTLYATIGTLLILPLRNKAYPLNSTVSLVPLTWSPRCRTAWRRPCPCRCAAPPGSSPPSGRAAWTCSAGSSSFLRQQSSWEVWWTRFSHVPPTASKGYNPMRSCHECLSTSARYEWGLTFVARAPNTRAQSRNRFFSFWCFGRNERDAMGAARLFNRAGSFPQEIWFESVIFGI